MREIAKNVYHLGDSGCSVFLIDTQSEDGLVLIDCGMSLEMIQGITKYQLNPINIKHCLSLISHQSANSKCIFYNLIIFFIDTCDLNFSSNYHNIFTFYD